MPLNIAGVALALSRPRIPCLPAGGTAVATVTVTGGGMSGGGAYEVELRDVGAGIDLLDSATGTAPGGPLNAVHTFTLTCDSACEVTGRLGSSGNQAVTLQARAKSGAAAWVISPNRTLTCGAGTYRPRRKPVLVTKTKAKKARPGGKAKPGKRVQSKKPAQSTKRAQGKRVQSRKRVQKRR
jgi:hypothetical protein